MRRRSSCASRNKATAAVPLAAILAAALLAACPQPASHASSELTSTKIPPNAAATKPKPAAAKSPTAQQTGKTIPAFTTRFNGQRAYADLNKQVSFGPRVPNTSGHRVCRKWLEQQLLASCDKVEQQEFTVPHGGTPLKMVNLIGRFRVDQPRRVILAAHWDTRPSADMNPEGQRNRPIPGANDGASGVAVLLELARLLKETPPPAGVDLVLFDGEDYGPGLDMMFLGAKYFAGRLSDGQARGYNYGILLDMVGDRNLDIHAENNSHARASLVFDVAYEVSRGLGYNCFKRSDPYTIYDDHQSLLDRGVKMYDFIDFTYEPWHTTQDSADKCSAASLEEIGRTVENMVYLYPNIYAPPK